MYVSMLNDLGGVDQTIWLGYLDGHYDSSNPPWGLNKSETFGLSPNLHGPNGPMGISIAHGHYGRGPILNMEFTNDKVTWISYFENANEFVISDLMAVASTDAFSSVIEYSQPITMSTRSST
jgi:hypothetical protein